ncbi:transporter substrate-binding domain-containing protein [Rhodoferax saidenbachensis]|uniref:Polar amino acid transport system substrate-binding protein n=1 Tax=Rhodoferax saidenbachensis TaxID=1484693 RepID=A0ABU1ZIJ4_9BURK|nr:transporter substrate-binding domain-containing protein [Rhodoferax saidenbachensis]MDR7304781.1 polar amino acid transport system substrate-binding protein [Rhodoferax saidenbachensis]
MVTTEFIRLGGPKRWAWRMGGLAVILMNCAMAQCVQAAESELKLLVASQVAPKMFLDDDGKPTGYVTQVAAAIIRRAGYTPVVEAVPWARAYKLAQEGEGVLAGLSKTIERGKIFSFTDVVLEDRVQVITLKKADLKISQFSDLKGKRVGIQRGSSYGEQFEAALPLFHEDRDNSGDSRLNKLVAERIDAAVLSGGNTAVKYYSKLAGVDMSLLTVQTPPLVVDLNYIGIAKTRPDQAEVMSRLNAAIAAMRADGGIAKIVAAWEH